MYIKDNIDKAFSIPVLNNKPKTMKNVQLHIASKEKMMYLDLIND
jgi:hypothetical protein